MPLLLNNNTDKAATFNLRTQLPPGWSIDSNSTQYAHHALPENAFLVGAHDYFPVRIRLVAPQVSKSQWQEITWTAEANGFFLNSLKIRVGNLPRQHGRPCYLLPFRFADLGATAGFVAEKSCAATRKAFSGEAW